MENQDNTIHFFVRTIPERKFNYGSLPITVLSDVYHYPIHSFIESLELINKYNSVLLEDDLVLCKNFKEEVEKAIAQYPNNIIQFFTDPGIYENTHLRSYPFEFNQCTYYPKGLGEKIANKMKELLPKFPPDQILYSQIESRALLELAIPHIVYRPCLVQHNNQKTILRKNKHHFEGMETIWFKDYLDILNVPYEEAYNLETINKLFNLKQKHFNFLKNRFEKEGY